MTERDNSTGRRQFLTASLAASIAASVAAPILPTMSSLVSAKEHPVPSTQQYFEIRIHRVETEEKGKIVGRYLEKALVPALHRQGVERVGVFQPIEEGSFDYYTLITYPAIQMLAAVNDELEMNEAYQKAAAEYFAQPLKDPSFRRVESRLMKAFAGMPTLELPSPTKEKSARILELRIYESPHEKAARLKVEMFNKGEIAIMRDVQLAPVFFGETLISNDVPNLTYMLSAEDSEAHKEHWAAFRVHPEWLRMKKLERYQDTVSKIHSVMLKPTSFSQI
ncbi:MAG: hypothetical protein ACI9HK_000896 [Pirellulaceae bacterium]|jgi:hypothetical protein